MATDYDFIVAGLGAMGSAAAYHLAAGGNRVLGLDRFKPPHEQGSSHGRSRIIREAYFEDPLYVPLVQRAYELWHALGQATGRRLLLETGGVMVGSGDGMLVRGAKRSAEEHRLRHQVLSATELQQRFPALRPEPQMVAVWEPRAGILFPELGIQSHLEMAARAGAELKFNTPMLTWEPHNGGVRVSSGSGTYTATGLLLTTGAWTSQFVAQFAGLLSVERQVMFWFTPRGEPQLFEPGNCPIFIWEYEPRRYFYGFPDLGDGMKIAIHHEGQKTTPDEIVREVSLLETEAVRALLRRFLPEADGRLNSSAVCMYTNTPDEHFLIDFHPQHPQVLIASPCSGHGFKFSPVIGEIAAALLTKRSMPFDLSLFSLRRFLSCAH